MQHIPHHSLDDIERGRQEMQDFREERNRMLTGEDIHNAFCRMEPDESRPWGSLNLVAQRRYNALAQELNKMFEADEPSITAIRCPSCEQMLTNLKNHFCL